ncbi:MAG: hypothetical protein ACHQIL_02885 [Steroidobacterales bacterium]
MVAGISTAVTDLVAIGHARAIIEWSLQQGPGVIRLTSAADVALGSSLLHRVLTIGYVDAHVFAYVGPAVVLGIVASIGLLLAWGRIRGAA